MVPIAGARPAIVAPTAKTRMPSRNVHLRPQMSVSLLPVIIKAAITRVKSVMAVWTPVTVVPRSCEMLEIETFRAELA